LDHAACRDALERAEADLSVAEFHGTLCAFLCTRPRPRVEAWVAEIVTSEHPPQGSAWARALCEAGERTRAALAEGAFSLELLLPDDDEPLSERGAALADWCTGFLYGLGLAGDGVGESLSAEAREVIADLAEFTRIDSDEESSSDAESALAEIVEYVRVGVLLIYEELMRADAAAPGRNRLH
jgi:uncharacterized protein YgfB (UPF0149 family)